MPSARRPRSAGSSILVGAVAPLDGVEAGAADVWELDGRLDARDPARAPLRAACRPRERGSTGRARPPSGARAFLAEASPLLDASLDLRSTLDSLTRLSVPFLGDVCVVDEIHLARSAGSPRRRRPAVERLVRDLPARYAVAPATRSRACSRPAAPRSSPAPTCSARPPTGRLQADFARAMLVPLKARGRIIGIVVFASLDARPPLRHRGSAAGRGPRPPRGARARQRAALRGPRVGRARAAGGAAPAAAAGARRRRARRALPPGGRRQPDRRRLLRRAAARGRRRSRDRRRHRQGRARRGADQPGPPHGADRRAVRGHARAACWTSSTARCWPSAPSAAGATARSRSAGSSSTGPTRATICCAGHPMPMVMRGSGAVEHVGRPGSVLGWVDDPKLLDVDVRARAARVARAVHRRRDGGAHDRRRVRARRPRGAAARGGAARTRRAIAARVDRAAARAGRAATMSPCWSLAAVRRGGTSAG